MKKKILITLAVIIAVVFGTLAYFNILAPIKMEEVIVECIKWDNLPDSVENTAEDYENGELVSDIMVYEFDELYPAESREDYSCVSIDFEWKNRSLFEKQEINCYITEIDPSGMAMYSIETQEIYPHVTFVKPGEKEIYGVNLFINLGDHTDEEVIEMLKTVTVHCVIEGEYTKTKAMDIKLSEVCDFSKVVIDRTYEE